MSNESEGAKDPESAGNGGLADEATGGDELTAKAAALQKAEKTAAELQDRLLRTAAEFENWKKRVKKELDDATARGQESLLKELFAVLDNLERALQHAPKDNPLTVGVQMVEKQFLAALEKFNVTRFSAMGEVFDPARHDAISHMETNDHAPGTVAQEFAKGYTMGQRLLRPAMVAVAKALPKASEGGGQSNDPTN